MGLSRTVPDSRDTRRFQSKIAKFSHPRVLCAPANGVSFGIGIGASVRKTGMMALPDGPKLKDRFSRLETIPACERQTHRRTSFDGKDRASIASRG